MIKINGKSLRGYSLSKRIFYALGEIPLIVFGVLMLGLGFVFVLFGFGIAIIGLIMAGIVAFMKLLFDKKETSK